jgi:hypothetical protein
MYFFETRVDVSHDVQVSSDESVELQATGAARLREYFWAMLCLIAVTCFSILTGVSLLLLSLFFFLVAVCLLFSDLFNFFIIYFNEVIIISLNYFVLTGSCLGLCHVLWWLSRCGGDL